MENQFTKMQNGFNVGYVIMALSDHGFPALPFDAEYNLNYIAAGLAKDPDGDWSEFDRNFRYIWTNIKRETNWTQAKALAKLNGINKMLGVSVFSKSKDAKKALKIGEIGDCGGQYMIWGYDKKNILPNGLGKKILNRGIDWGVFPVQYRPGEPVKLLSEQPLMRYFDKDYQEQMRTWIQQIDSGMPGFADKMEKKLNAGKTEVDGPKTVRELYSFLDEQDKQENGDTWIYWNVEGQERRVQPYFKKATQHTVEMQLQSPILECSVNSLFRAVENILDDYVLKDNKKDKYFVFKNGDKAYEIGSVTKTSQRIEFNMIDWGMDESKTLIDEVFDHIYECDGGCGDDGGCGGGTTTGDVLGPGGTAENEGGCMGKDDFHVPFPVMPCLFRWPANWVGGSQKKRKKGKKTVTVKNPYIKGMKTIVAEDDNIVHYTGAAKEEFDKIVGPANHAYTGVLNYNDVWKLAWMIREDGILHFYKPYNTGSFWTVYATHLTEDGMIMLDYKAGKYPTETAALNAIYKAAKEHEKKLQECLEKLKERTNG